MNVMALYRGRKTWWLSFTSWRPRILRVGYKLNRVEAQVDDYDELGDSMTRWKDVAWFRLSKECEEDGKDLESKIDDVMVTRSLQGGDGAACNVWCRVLYLSFGGKHGLDVVHVEKDGDTRIHACFRDELDNVVEEEDGGWIFFLGGNNSLGTKKYQRSNSSDYGNTGDGVKIAGGVIGFGGGIDDSLA
ncbi:hypothetical protein Tco_1058208 [Tanacetum coccineum]|uniref:Uncharacterized protein n=1 Tax=Tanacetum coccineum TaxID=301880 RepID=A0ABQ5H7P0_9ASTR